MFNRVWFGQNCVVTQFRPQILQFYRRKLKYTLLRVQLLKNGLKLKYTLLSVRITKKCD